MRKRKREDGGTEGERGRERASRCRVVPLRWEPKIHMRLGSGSQSRSSIAARKAPRGRGAVWIRQRISPTSTWDVRCNEFCRSLYAGACASSPKTRCAIKWSKRAGVRKFDDEVEEKEAKEDEGREGRSSAKGRWRMRGKGE